MKTIFLFVLLILFCTCSPKGLFRPTGQIVPVKEDRGRDTLKERTVINNKPKIYRETLNADSAFKALFQRNYRSPFADLRRSDSLFALSVAQISIDVRSLLRSDSLQKATLANQSELLQDARKELLALRRDTAVKAKQAQVAEQTKQEAKTQNTWEGGFSLMLLCGFIWVGYGEFRYRILLARALRHIEKTHAL